MPFDGNKYDGIFCYALIHLLDSKERKKLIQDCYNQLTENGFMVFLQHFKNRYVKTNPNKQNGSEIFPGMMLF